MSSDKWIEAEKRHEEKNHCPYALRYALCALLSAEAQQPKKIPRIGILTGAIPYDPGAASRHFGKGCANSATWRGKTSSLSSDMRREN